MLENRRTERSARLRNDSATSPNASSANEPGSGTTFISPRGRSRVSSKLSPGAVNVVATLPASEEVMAHALYELGEVSKELGNNPTSGDAYHQRLLEQYPNTTWASKVR